MKSTGRQVTNVSILAIFLALAWGSGDSGTNSNTTGSSSNSGPTDVDYAYRIGEAAVNSGVAVEYDVSGWNQEIDITISSILPGDARLVADELCKAARPLPWSRPWSIRVFLTVGDRPAAVCRTK